MYRVLHGTCGEAVELGLLATNPVAGLSKRLRLSRKSGKDGEEIKALDVEQAAKFLAAVPPKLFAIFHLLIETGLRLGELLALEWADVNLDARTLTVSKTMTCQDKAIGATKTGAARTVDLSADLVVTLKAHALSSGRREGFLFAPETASRRTVRHRVEKAMFKALQRAGLRSLHPALLEAHLRQHHAVGGRSADHLRAAPAWPPEHPADREHLREVVASRQAVRGRLEALATNGNKNGGEGKLTV